MLRKKGQLFTVLIICLSALLACDDKETEEKVGNTESKKNQSEVKENDNDNDNEKKQVDFEVTGAEAPEDLGDMNVWFKGNIALDGQNLMIDGLTNLLPGSKLYILTNGIEAGIIGGNTVAIVDDNGKFIYENKLPEKFDGLFTLEIQFKPEIQNHDIKEHYGETGENLEGDFVRSYDFKQNEIVYEKAAAIIEFAQQDGQTEATIEPPVWEKPEDYGTTNIRIEPSMTKDDRYIYVDAKSNLLEGTKVTSRASIPGYITSGFIGVSYVNPDGSFRLVFENPENEERIKDLTDYEVILTVLVANSSFGTVYDTYGKNGEHFTGDLAEVDGDNKLIRYKMKVSAK